ncbi:septum site-determining protein Ssd [Specibacter cremeus]|uniref:septum site-determining protein Ssd n=1 Tax=Specibacter cremeus TaxID=1629051 RepID=UPI000F7A750E|nr:septum site-determining protein Ssd [Specibacter cremeus]
MGAEAVANGRRRRAGWRGGAPAGGGFVAGGSPSWLPAQSASVVLVCGSPAVQGEVGRVAAAAAVELVVVESWERAVAVWADAAALLVGTDMGGVPAGWSGPLVVVGLDADAARVWERASGTGADRVAVLPQAAHWLAEHLARLRDPAATGAVVGVIGGCGGSGASTLSALLAVGAAAAGVSTLLVDGDEWGGGLDLALDAADLPGLRWPDIVNAAGAINPGQLAASLPAVHGCSLLSWGARFPVAHEAVPGRAAPPGAGSGRVGGEVLRAARHGYGLAVVDVGRSREALAALGGHCDVLLMVVPARLRAAAAATRLLAEMPPVPVALVVRGPLREGLDAELVARAVGAPCLGSLPVLRRAAAATEAGRLAELASGRAVRRFLAAVLDAVLAGGDGMRATGTEP